MLFRSVVSLRGDSNHLIPSPVHPGTTISSDSILSYSINPTSGVLTFANSVPSGGNIPRQFSLNNTGDKIAIVSQRDGWVSIFERDIVTGKIGKLIGTKGGFGGPNDMGPVCILWDSTKA